MAVKYLSASGTQALIDEIKRRLNLKADWKTTLAGYGITDTYTKTQVDIKLDAIPDADDYTVLQQSIGDLSGTVAGHTTTLATLNADASTTGSIQNQITTAIANAGAASFQIVDEVPNANVAVKNVIYLVNDATRNVYTQWILVENSSGTKQMLDIGETNLDLSAYEKTADVNTKISNLSTVYASKTEFDTVKSTVNTTLVPDNTANKTAIALLQTDNATNKTDIAQLQSDVSTNTSDISDLKTTVQGHTSSISVLRGQTTDLQTAVTKLNGDSEVVGSVDYKIAQATGAVGSFIVVETLPDAAEATNKAIYLVKDDSVTGTDKYKEYIVVTADDLTRSWECIGDTSMDMSDYQTKNLSSEIEGASTVEGALAALSAKTIDVDDALDSVSENPVQNKVVKRAVDSRLRVVDSMPASPTAGDVVLYVGSSTSDYSQGGIYMYTTAWNLISTADVDLSAYKTNLIAETTDDITADQISAYDTFDTTGEAGDGVMVFGSVAAGDHNAVDGDSVYNFMSALGTMTMTSSVGVLRHDTEEDTITVPLPSAPSGMTPNIRVLLILLTPYGAGGSHGLWTCSSGLQALNTFGKVRYLAGSETITPTIADGSVTVEIAGHNTAHTLILLCFWG